MWPGFDSQTRRHMWVEFVVVSRPWGPFLDSTGNLPGPISIFVNVFFADYTVITDMVLGQCFHKIIRF